MTKKQFIEKIDKFKPKYIYQRYNGNLIKCEVVDNNFLVDVKTGMSFDFRAHIMLGKVSENIIDLIEVGDYLEILADGEPLRFEVDEIDYKHKLKDIAEDIKIKSIITKEQMENIEYLVED